VAWNLRNGRHDPPELIDEDCEEVVHEAAHSSRAPAPAAISNLEDPEVHRVAAEACARPGIVFGALVDDDVWVTSMRSQVRQASAM